MSKREPLLLLQDIVVSCDRILTYTNGYTLEMFVADQKTIDAVVRNFEIIGEAANQLPQDFRNEHNIVNWLRVRGFRNRLIHEYFGVSLDIIWDVIQDEVSHLKSDINQIIDNYKSLDD